jgi:hypothetical protein
VLRAFEPFVQLLYKLGEKSWVVFTLNELAQLIHFLPLNWGHG